MTTATELDSASTIPTGTTIEGITSAVRAMRRAGARRIEATLYVCRRMLYEFGEPPSAAKVREITEWGSITDVQEDVRAFFQSLKNPSAGLLPGSGLPAALQSHFSQGLAELYSLAHQHATELLAAERAAIDAQREAWATEDRERAALLSQASEELSAATRAVAILKTELEQAQLRAAGAEELAQARAERLDSVQSHLAESLRKESTLQAETIARAADAQRQIQEISAAAEQRRVPLLQEIDNLRQRARTLEVSSAVAQSQLAEALAAAKVQEASFQGTVALLDAKTTLVKNQQDRIEELQRAVEVAGHATQKAQASESQALAREAAVRTQLAKREKLVAPRAAGSRKAQPARGPKA